MAPSDSQQLPPRQRVVIIGAGIVGNSVAYHLTQLGETDITLLDKGPLPNPGGSTGHASNFIFPVDHSKEMTALTLESMRQYKELDVYLECGGIEVARTEARMQELDRRMVSAKRGASSRPRCSRRLKSGSSSHSSTRTCCWAASTRRAPASSTRCSRRRSCASAPSRLG